MRKREQKTRESKENGRVTKELLFVNSSKNVKRLGWWTATFKDKQGNLYIYDFSRENKFHKNALEKEYYPLLETRKHKEYIQVSFRREHMQTNPLTGKETCRMMLPRFLG